MADPAVDFLLESVMHLPRPADLKASAQKFQRLGLQAATSEKAETTLHVLMAEYAFPEGNATVYVFITNLMGKLPQAWRPEAGVPAMRVTATCQGVPRVRAESMARDLFRVIVDIAKAMDAFAGYVDLGTRQESQKPPAPWATFHTQARSFWRRRQPGTIVTQHRETPFPEGFAADKLGFPPKPKEPTPACLLVAGAVLLGYSPIAIDQAKEAGLTVWRAEFVTKPPCLVAGLLVASLDLSQSQADVKPDLAVQIVADAREKLERTVPGTPAGLLMVRVMDRGGL